jgi:hypothetical protein
LGNFFRFLPLASRWLEDYAKFTPTPEENDQYSADRLNATQAASQSTFINAL